MDKHSSNPFKERPSARHPRQSTQNKDPSVPTFQCMYFRNQSFYRNKYLRIKLETGHRITQGAEPLPYIPCAIPGATLHRLKGGVRQCQGLGLRRTFADCVPDVIALRKVRSESARERSAIRAKEFVENRASQWSTLQQNEELPAGFGAPTKEADAHTRQLSPGHLWHSAAAHMRRIPGFRGQ